MAIPAAILALIQAGKIAAPLAARTIAGTTAAGLQKAKNVRAFPDPTMKKLVNWKNLDETGRMFYTGALGIPAATVGIGGPAIIGMYELQDRLNTGQWSVPEEGPMRFAGRKATHYPRFRYDRSGRSSWKGGY